MAIRELFARHELRWTKQREDVYGALASNDSHPTAEELFRMVRRPAAAPGGESHDSGGTSLATVYNTLEALVRCGLARRLAACAANGGGAFRYDAEMSDHAHLVAGDGQIRDLPGDLGQRVVDSIPSEVIHELEQRMGIRIGRLSVEFVEAADEPRGHQN